MGADPAQLPDFMGTSPVFLGPAYVSQARSSSASAVAATVITLHPSPSASWRGGVALRATATDQGARSSPCGIDVPVVSLRWLRVFAVWRAAGAGILVGAVGGISPGMGVRPSALVVVTSAGLDSVVAR